MKAGRELPIPPAAQRSSDAAEIISVWISDGAPSVVVRSGIWDDPASWGILLADILGHIVKAHANTGGIGPDVFRRRVLEGFRAETG